MEKRKWDTILRYDESMIQESKQSKQIAEMLALNEPKANTMATINNNNQRKMKSTLSPKWTMSTFSFFVLIVSINLMIISQVGIILARAKQEAPSRKSIVFDVKTPKVFYCPQEKPADPDKMIVKAQPLGKLCEFGGKQKPKNLPSDCYKDVDESEFACDEKKRFMIRLDLAGEMSSAEGIDDFDYIMAKSSGSKKKMTSNGKKY